MIRIAGASFSIAPLRCFVASFAGLAIGLVAASPPAAQTRSETAVPVYKSILSDKAGYHGPERSEPDPQEVREVRIGFFAPRASENPVGRNMWRGAVLAVEKANAEGGYRKKPFRLVSRWAGDPWGAGSREMTRLVYEDKVWAVIGSINGASTHVAQQVATRARIVLLSPLSGDSSLTHAAVPWMFRMPPDDSCVAETLVGIAVGKMGYRRIILLSSTDHDGRAGASEVASALRRRLVPPIMHLTFDASQSDFSRQIDRISSTCADAIFLWGLPEPSLRILLALRERGINLPVFAPAGFSLPSFLQRAGSAAEGLTTCRLTWGRDSARSRHFVTEFQARFGERPADEAALTYDAAIIVIEAIRKAGLNRARIRDAVAGVSGFAGLAGKVTWDNGGGNIAFAEPVRVHNGRLSEIEQ